MAYTDIAEMAADQDLRQRLYACVASLGYDNGSMWVDRWIWVLVASDSAWSDSWAAAVSTSDVLPGEPTVIDARRGWDSAVITDQMITDRIRAVYDTKGAI